jgi:lipase ATG15
MYLQASSKPTSIKRLKDREPSTIEKLLAGARQYGYTPDLSPTAWTTDNILSPNVSDKETVLTFARMAIDAYYINDTCQGWDPVGHNITSNDDFGWEGDGLRGHVFADTNNSTVVISFKGTSKGRHHYLLLQRLVGLY